jgi:hypothetical protein
VPELRPKRNFFLNKRRTSSIAGQESTFAVPRTFAQERRTFSTFFFYIGIAYSATLRKETCVLVKSAILSALLRRCHACPGVLVVAGKMAQIHVVFFPKPARPGADPLNVSVFWKQPRGVS